MTEPAEPHDKPPPQPGTDSKAAHPSHNPAPTAMPPHPLTQPDDQSGQYITQPTNQPTNDRACRTTRQAAATTRHRQQGRPSLSQPDTDSKAARPLTQPDDQPGQYNHPANHPTNQTNQPMTEPAEPHDKLTTRHRQQGRPSLDTTRRPARAI